MTSTQGKSIVEILIADHRSVEQVFSELEQHNGTPEHRRSLMNHAITELVRHTAAEEQYLYPACREKLSDGNQVADKEVQEHTEAEQLLHQLETVDATDPEFERLTGKLIDSIRRHVSDEENNVLPRLSQACTPQELDDLGKKVSMAKESAPTHPHPSAPKTPPANLLLDPGAGMVDRLRDALSGSR